VDRSLYTSDGVAITFLANEGVLLTGGGKKVLIDAPFLKYKTGFTIPADSTRAALEAGRVPFDADLLLFTHYHGDHFHPAPVTAHLRANSKARLVASAQVLDSLRLRVPADDATATRLLSRTTPIGTKCWEVVNGVRVEFLGLKHHDLQHLTSSAGRTAHSARGRQRPAG
jgi:L-ascorbate metabolism protein UlaG (beta-lactamase superfamily)